MIDGVEQCVRSEAHLDPCMAAQVEVKLRGVCDGVVHRGACWDVTALPNLQGEINRA